MSGSHSYDHEPKYSCPHFDETLDIMQRAHADMHTAIEAAREINHTLREQNIEFMGTIGELERENKLLEAENENLKEEIQQMKSEGAGVPLEQANPAIWDLRPGAG